MKQNYEVMFVKSIYVPVYVEAESRDEAQDIANEILDDSDFDLTDCYSIDVSDVGEVDEIPDGTIHEIARKVA